MDMERTRELFAKLIQRPALTDQLLQRPPFKFLHDIVRETLQSTGYPGGLFTEDELDSAKAGSSRDAKIAFLQKLIDVLNIDGNLDDVKPAKIVAGKEPEMTNMLLQSLASEAAMFKKEAKKATKKSSSSSKPSKTTTTKSSSSSKSRTNVEEKPSKLAIPEKKPAKSLERKSSSSKEKSAKDGGTTKEKERKKKRSESSTRSKITTAATVDVPVPPMPTISPVDPQQSLEPSLGMFDKTSLPDTRTPPDRESSGGTSKGGDDSGIAEETGAESERHDLSERYGPNSALIGTKTSTPEFMEVQHSPHTSTAPLIRPGTAIGRPQTSIGRPGTALARPAPPKPKKNVIATNVTAEEELKKEAKNQFILEDNKEEGEEKVESFLVEEDDEQLLMGAGSVEGTNIAKLEEGEDHGTLVNKIIENTRELEKEHMQDDTFLVDDSTDQHEMRRIRAEIEAAQKGLQTATQYVQPFVRILEFVLDDFDTMLRDLEECRKQSAVLERKLDEQLATAGSQNELDAALHKLDTETRSTREQIARATATIVRNERKMAELLAIDSSNSN